MICWILFVILIILYALSLVVFIIWKNNRQQISPDNYKYYNELLEKHKNLENKYNDLFKAFGNMTHIANTANVLKNISDSNVKSMGWDLDTCKKDLETCKNK